MRLCEQKNVLIKCADISNVLKPFAVARRWAFRITDEFFQQGDEELARGMAITPICDPATQSLHAGWR
ncbi:hypothetical protein T484DRAFT_1807011 [Baffinella frigidus]|nr:hypothetical protein T484DRAFT_1807011 [Cryptophyta sp. CCMP2293]